MNQTHLYSDGVKQHFLCWTVLLILYFVSAKLGIEYAVIGKTVTLIWPPSGIGLAATLIYGYRVWPGIALGSFAANAWTAHLTMDSVFIITAGDTLEPLCGAMLLKRQPQFSITLDKNRDVLKLLILAACGSTMVGATLGTLGLYADGEINQSDFEATWITWWLGDGMGVLVISPVILAGFATLHNLALKHLSIHAVELSILFIAEMVIGHIIFESPELAGLGYFQTSLLMFPFAIWSALRFGTIGAASTALLVSLLAVHGTVNGTGPFAVESKLNSLILWALFADLMAITGLILAAVDSGRKRALAALKVANETLDKQVRERTSELLKANLELHATLAERNRLQLEMSQISEDRQKMIGQELHDGLGQQLTGVAFLVSSLAQTLKDRSASEATAIANIKQLLDGAMETLRSLSRGLYPTALETGGLYSALQHLAEYSQSSSGIQCTLRCNTRRLEIDKTIALNLYRIAQEAVCNALRHSLSESIEITLLQTDGRYQLTVADNGIGLPARHASFGGSLGMRSMQSRAELIGANIEFRNNAEGGMSIRVAGSIHHAK